MATTIQIEQYENLINKAVWTTKRNWEGSGIEFDELKSQAYLVFCEAIERFDNEKGVKFSTFLTWRLRTLNDYAAYNSRRTAYIPESECDEDLEYDMYGESTEFQAFSERLELVDAAASLSNDSRELLNRLLAGEFQKVDMGNKKPSLNTVRKGMKNIGWSAGRVEDAWSGLQSWWKYY